MKKYLLLCFSFLIVLTATAAPWDIKSPKKKEVLAWDKALQVKTYPEIVQLRAVKQYDQLFIEIVLDSYVPWDMKATVWVRTYRSWGFPAQWGWMWVEYDVPLDYDGSSNGYNQPFPINSLWQYEGHSGNFDTWIVNQDQINMTYYGDA